MKTRALLVAALLSLPIAASAEPTTISNVSVVVGGRTFTAESVGWQLPVTLQSGQSLVLAQNYQGRPDDTSSYTFALAGLQDTPVVLIGADRWHIIYDSRQTLTARWNDTPNKATDWDTVYAADNIEVSFGYADNLHNAPCLIAGCFPDRFFSPTFFQGAFGYMPPSTEYRPADKCIAQTCMNSAAIRIRNTDYAPPPQNEHHSAAWWLFGTLALGTVLTTSRSSH